jgi:anaerobic magnesium-protoporphyrin IX monomethyl ester cyclase
MKPLLLFVRPPRPLWPLNGPSSGFWPPLAFASLAAAVREHVPEVRIEILDAPALQMGWRTLEAELRRRQPYCVGMGEEAVSCVEALRLAGLAREVGACVIAGGCFFGHVAPQVLQTGFVDVVVHGEGELTIVELVRALLESRPNLQAVRGISFRRGVEAVTTPPRELVADLDDLPMPAYDLLPVERYGAGSRNHPQLAAIELGRGCVGACDFCVLWRQMGRVVDGRATPHYRVKSPERVLEEVRVLSGRFGRRYLGWVDPCFNADPDVPAAVAELMLREGLRLGQGAWMRTDALLRDARSGALASCVRAGLNEVYLGVERADEASLKALNKTASYSEAQEAVRVLNQQHPQVFTMGSFIYGLPGDTPATMRAMHRQADLMGLDSALFIPHTPLPGTVAWKPGLWDATGQAFRQFGFLPSYRAGNQLGRLERALLMSLVFNWNAPRLRSYVAGLWQGDYRRRRVNRRLKGRGAAFHLRQFLGSLLSDRDPSGLVFPAWYES